MKSGRRKFVPLFDSLEEHCLMSAGLVGPHEAVVHLASKSHHHGPVDLRHTQVGADAYQSLAQSVPQTGLAALNLTKLNVDRFGTIHGASTAIYVIPGLGRIRVSLQFNTNVDNPNPGNVSIRASRFNSSITPDQRAAVAQGVVAFIQNDAPLIHSLTAGKF